MRSSTLVTKRTTATPSSHTTKAPFNTLESLRDRNIVYVYYGSTSRVPKYKHMLPTVLELEPGEVAVIA